MLSGKSWLLLLSTIALAQDVTFRSSLQEVVVPVVVRDSSGRPVGGLKVEDFQLFDRGKRQTIASFTALGNRPVPPGGSGEPVSAGAGSTAVTGAGSSAIRVPLGERSVAYVFDDLNTGFVEFARTREGALHYFEAGLPAEEMAAIYSFSGRTSLSFTTDRDKLKEAVSKLRVSRTPMHGDADPCPSVSYYLADFIVRRNDSRALEAVTRQTMDCAGQKHDEAQQIAKGAAEREVLIGDQDIRLWAATLRRVIRLLQERPAPRVLVLASSGLYSQTPKGMKAIADTVDLAAHAGVTIGTLQARGIDTMAQADSSRSSAPTALERGYYSDSVHAEENTLADLANATGGRYLGHNNDLAAGFAQLSAPPEYSYVLGFSPSALKPDGGYHELKVRLPGHGTVSLEARPGYYAPMAPKKGWAEDAIAEEVDDAVQAGDETSGIPVDAVVQTSREGKADARLSVLAEIHVKPLTLEKVNGRNHGVLMVATVIFDQDGGYVVGNRNTVNLMLRDQSLTGKEDPAVNVQSNFQVRPGSYMVRVVVCDQSSGNLSSRNVRVVVR